MMRPHDNPPRQPYPRTRRLPAAAVMILATVVAMLAATTAPATAAPADPGAATWAVLPADTGQGHNRAHFDYTLAPGATLNDAIAVINEGDTPITLSVYAADAITTAGGALDLLPAGTPSTDLGSWITLQTSSITLKPQQSALVPFTLTVPANATPGDHTAGIVTSLVTTATTTAVRVDRRLGSRIYLRVTGALTPGLRVSDVHTTYHGTLDPASAGTATITYTVSNTGNLRLQAHQQIRITGLLGAITQTAALGDLPQILPGGSLTRTVTVSNIWPGLHMRVTVREDPYASTDDAPVAAATGSTALWAWPAGQLLVLLALLLAATAYLILRRRRRRRVQAAIDEAVSTALASAAAVGAATPTAHAAAGSDTAADR